jgi:hypothetical protein
MGFAIGSAVCLLVGAARWTWARVEVMRFWMRSEKTGPSLWIRLQGNPSRVLGKTEKVNLWLACDYVSAETIGTYQGRQVVANCLAGERQELVKVKIVVGHFCCKLDLIVVEEWIVSH